MLILIGLFFLLLPIFLVFFTGFVIVFIIPLLCGLLLIGIVRVLGWALKIEKTPMLWKIYTGVCAIRGIFILFSDTFMDKMTGKDLNLLLKEYALVSLVVLLLWILIEKIFKPIMGKTDRIERKSTITK